MLPNSLLYIGAVLENGGHQVANLDQQVDARKAAFFQASTRNWSASPFRWAASSTRPSSSRRSSKPSTPRSRLSGATSIPACSPEQTLAEDYVDFVVIGPGEYTLLELADHLEKGTPPSCPISVESLSGTMEKSSSTLTVLSSKTSTNWRIPPGTWCRWKTTGRNPSTPPAAARQSASSATTRRSTRASSAISAERIVAQMETLKTRYGVTLFRFFEDDFCHNGPRLHPFCKLVIEKKMRIAGTATPAPA